MRRRGLSLAELVMALGLASLSVLSMVAYFGGMHKAAAEGHSQASATTVAVEVLERMGSDAAFLAQVTSTPSWTVTEPTREGDGRREARTFRVRVTQAPLDGERRYVDAVVRVDWREGGRTREIVLETVLPCPDPDL